MNRFFSTRILCSAVIVVLLASPAAVFAEKKKADPAPTNEVKEKPETASSSLSGKVAETMNAGEYTYILLEKKGKKTWVAVPKMKVAVGQKIALQPGAEMNNFHSQSLNRTFDTIIFSSGPASARHASAPAAGYKEERMTGIGSTASAAPAEKGIKVEKAEGPDSYTVGDVFAKREELDKKIAVVRGKVVKVSKGIMGANWVHLQDGTGDAGIKTHDLVITTQELPSVGEVVTMSGTVSKDRDFGAGYRYTVIIEKASIKR